ncbi:putative motility protein [Ureibacillus sp. NPDC094379]
MELSSIMASQLRDLQQTVQMSVMQNALNMHTTAAVEMLREMPQQQSVTHPFKGQSIDVSV